MTGAIIPDDWDGSTFICQKIEWPASPQWQAILLGQVSEPSQEKYWDKTTGDVGLATEAVVDSFALTVPEVYEEDCDEMPVIPVPAFSVRLSAPYSIEVAEWSTIPWANYLYEYNNPGFDFLAEGHQASDAGLFGVWHYDYSIFSDEPVGTIIMRARILETGQMVAITQNTGNLISMGFDFVWTTAGWTLITEIWSSPAADILANNGHTYFSGHYVGPVVEP